MSPEIIAIIGSAIALAAAILPGQYAMRRDIAGLHRDIADLRERMARLEGLFEGFTRREQPTAMLQPAATVLQQPQQQPS